MATSTEVIAVRRSESLLFTSRETNGHENETVALTARAGLVRQFGSGLYGFTPTGQRVRENLVALLEREMDAAGGRRISLPSLNDAGIWQRSGRWESFEGEMFTLENRDGKRLCLAPSHEEGAVHLVDGVVRSYDDLPLLVYQIERKHRDDHARNGLLRTKEFTMKDAYSFHATEDSLRECYERVRDAYVRVFESLGLEFVVAAADNSVMGGTNSEEFVALTETGAGTVEIRHCTAAGCRFGVTDESPRADLVAGDDCPECGGRLAAGEGIEVGHLFQLGTRYAEPMELTIDTAGGGQRHVLMGSYGIGVERLLHALLEQYADENGCRWPDSSAALEDGDVATPEIAPYRLAVIPLEYGDADLREAADRLHERCGTAETLLFDDPDRTIGERFAESDLLGIPEKAILGNHYRETGEVELEARDGTTRYAPLEDVPGIVS
ncbi:proline--tRNA ligase [Halobiforma lacisalsi AJ5]|uniref:proline--tRNA ligase n=1 Tax=Natronobacterium lacisalsi AJ5 TaxID=358396 RepID=M0LH52_NATLA|nr:proline--tRNA ligase [Halobiforma lacisalsi AJ5]EMA31759.1 prolyl-tRNA ligase [Halobiforma lacisalsi AJ5]